MSRSFDLELAKALRKQAPLDETLSSTLLRVLLAYEPNIKPIGVIGKSGNWVDAPFINKGYEHLFYRYSDNELLEIIDSDLLISGKGNGLFDDPTLYTHRIASTFFSGRKTRGRVSSSNKIRYCLPCIEDGIRNNGYGYFRGFWKLSYKCLIHDKPLKELPELGFTKALIAIKKLLKGNCSDFGKLMNEHWMYKLKRSKNMSNKTINEISGWLEVIA